MGANGGRVMRLRRVSTGCYETLDGKIRVFKMAQSWLFGDYHPSDETVDLRFYEMGEFGFATKRAAVTALEQLLEKETTHG